MDYASFSDSTKASPNREAFPFPTGKPPRPRLPGQPGSDIPGTYPRSFPHALQAMTGPERAALERLEVRLFGDDGNEGAIGLLTMEVRNGFSMMNGRVRILEGKHIAMEAVDGERRTNQDRMSSDRRWRTGLILGLATSIGIGIANGILNIVHP